MRLTYNILWVDDNRDQFQKLRYDEHLMSFLKDLYFTPSIYFVDNADEAKRLIVGNHRFDVVFSDYNISEHEKGDDFIKYVRENNVNTEILFYSAQEDVPSLQLNRISFFNIPKQKGYPELLSTMKELILLTIEKFQELTSMRGMVMAEVSDLDAMMQSLILDYFNTAERTEQFVKHIITNKENSVKSKLRRNREKTCENSCILKWREKSIQDIVVLPDFDSSLKARAMNIVLSDEKFYISYLDEIINVRNNLAHCQSEIRDGKEILCTKKGDVVFDKEKFVEIRHNIAKYNQLFELHMSHGAK